MYNNFGLAIVDDDEDLDDDEMIFSDTGYTVTGSSGSWTFHSTVGGKSSMPVGSNGTYAANTSVGTINSGAGMTNVYSQVPPAVLPSEAVIGFAAWLSCRNATLVCGSSYPSTDVLDLVNQYCDVQKFEKPRPEFPMNLTPMPLGNTISFPTAISLALDQLRNP